MHARHHIGKIEALAGNLPTALAWFSRADELLARLGTTDPLGLIDRCSALLPARLGEEAKTAAANAVSELKGGGNEHDLAEARLAYAEACLLTSDPAAASEAAGLAAASFRRRRVYRWAALAGFVALQARWADGDRSSDLLEASRRAAAQLERAGWIDAAAEARLLAGQLAMDLGRREVARRELRRAARRRGSQTAPARARAWQAEALLRLLDGHQGGARSAVRAGLRVVETHRATLGATELRARATGHGADLALLGLRMALEDGSAADVLGWAERWRAGTLHMAPGRPAGDTRLTRDLAELRRLAAEIESATLAGTDVAALRRRQGELEAAVNGRVRLVRGRGEATVTHPPSASGLAGALGDRVLVEMVELDGVLHAVVVGGRQRRRTNLVTLGANADVRAELDSVRFSLRRLARGRGSPAALGAARTALAHAANRLDELLVEPVRPMLGDRPLVLVPTGALHALPWSVLPTLSGRPVTVAPSAAMWLRADTATPKGNDTRFVLVAGPRLAGAHPEIATLARRYPDALRFTRGEATADAVSAALDGATLAHIAAHGRFRADNPMFSALDLADGPLTVHDLEALRRAPDTLVLSACDSGLSAVHPGDELLGLAASLFGLGTRTLVASLLPVSDKATRALMLAFHRHLQRGSTPAEALAAAQAKARATGDDAALAAAASFVCLGAG
ncbi:MAG: CHAT domain-containing protein [Acidimicrobiales bacterium]